MNEWLDKFFKGLFPPRKVFVEDKYFQKKPTRKHFLRTRKKLNFFQRPIFFYSEDIMWEFRVFLDSELGVKAKDQRKIKERVNKH